MTAFPLHAASSASKESPVSIVVLSMGQQRTIAPRRRHVKTASGGPLPQQDVDARKVDAPAAPAHNKDMNRARSVLRRAKRCAAHRFRRAQLAMAGLYMLGMLGLLGCGKPLPPPVEPVVDVPLEHEIEPPKVVRTGGGPSCVLRSKRLPWLGDDEGTPLRQSAATEPFAFVIGGRAELRLSAKTKGPAVALLVQSYGVQLSGVVLNRELPLYAARRITFEGFASPRPRTRLLWRGVGEEGLLVGYELRGGVDKDKLGAVVQCEDLSLNLRKFEAAPKQSATKKGRLARLLWRGRVPLSAEPGGPALAWLNNESADDDTELYTDQVLELAFDGQFSRILWKRQRELLFGWVPAAALYIMEDDGPEPFDELEENLPETEPELAESDALRCAVDVSLFIGRDGGPVSEVGVVRAGTVIEVLERSTPNVEIELKATLPNDGPFRLAPSVMLYARATDIAGCKQLDP